MIYHFYRQPLPLAQLRATMLAVFFALCIVRLVIVIASGGLEAKALNYGLASVPAVAAATWLSVRFPPPMSERFGRRFAFLLLALMGLFMCLMAAIPAE